MEPGNLYKFDDSRLYLSRNSYASFYPWLTSAETPWCNGQPDVRIDYYNHHSKTEKNIVWFLLEPVKYWSKEDDQKYSMYKNVLNLWVTMKFLVDDFICYIHAAQDNPAGDRKDIEKYFTLISK